MELFINEDGTEVRRRGCMTGNENHTCSDAYEEKKQCITLEDGQQVSLHVLTGFSATCCLIVYQFKMLKIVRES